jgi:diadenosine tetraphosphatase ApaH/serine/threonine PP2A family protein phosphatase
MRVLIVSDVHSNIEGLEAVIAEAQRMGAVDAVWCAGDIVGYGADPGAVIDCLRSFDLIAVAGNHDLAAIGKMTTDDFNAVAAAAAEWTAATLTAEHRAWLESLPPVTSPNDGFTIVHGSLRDPEWEYLLDERQADAQFALQKTDCSIIGHSHLPFWFEKSQGQRPRRTTATDGVAVKLGEERFILNPGSTGQPRDGDPRACFALYDSSRATVTWRRVPYDIDAAARKILAAGLPSFLAERLYVGR